MDYSKIRLKNERNAHVTKRLNRLNTWKFFKVLYRDNMWRLFAFSILMLICMAPIFGVQIWAQLSQTAFKQKLPMLNGLGFSTGVWTDVTEFYSQSVASQNIIFGLITVGAAVLLFLTFSGGFAVIRDAFWTGRLSTVGVFKSMGKGIAANWAYALVSVIISAFGIFGIFAFYPWAATVMPVWLAIVLTVLLSLLMFLVVCYLCILCSVSVTYKQSVYENLDDSWRLMWLNFLPNVIHLVIALVPVALYFVFTGGILQSIYMVLMLMFGGMFFPLVWHSHMMRTFALFHPVEKKKKDKVVGELPDTPVETQSSAASDGEPEAKAAKTRKKSKKSAAISDESVVTENSASAEVADAALTDPVSKNASLPETEVEDSGADDPYTYDDVTDGEISDSSTEVPSDKE
ncbi:MAG: hypothetical protein NC132_04515 [Corallococcus sp.]|nr:hypothetical protein [Corallococcus sp.]MCM1359649.1 hypothetical protein [Corallococcus sp.]MCM1395358.1 hypothetical protein [Corallococcus sp.]